MTLESALSSRDEVPQRVVGPPNGPEEVYRQSLRFLVVLSYSGFRICDV